MHESRRSFLTRMAWLAGGTLGLSSLAKAFSPNNNSESYPKWEELVEWARWCPSVHNLQPHKLKVLSPTEAELYYDPARLLPVGDPHSIFAMVAMGVFIEHLSIVAAEYGMTVSVKSLDKPITTSSKELTRFATLVMEPGNASEYLSKNLIKERRTSRIRYDGKELPERVFFDLSMHGGNYQQRVYHTVKKEDIDFIIELNQQTLFQDISSEADCKELDHLFRYSEEEAKRHKDGLWSRCMGFSGSLMKSVFQHHKRWERAPRKQLLAHHYKNSFDGTSTIAWLRGPFSTKEDYVKAGEFLARAWLTVTEEKAFIQPFGSLITNPEAYKKINARFADVDNPNPIWMIFRAGYSHVPARSYRLDTKDIMI